MTSPDEEARQREAFERWAQTISLRILKCRVQGHQFPDWDDQRRTKISRTRQGSYVIDAACARRCGVILVRYVSSDGYLERSNRITLDYSQAHTADRDPDKSYLMPKAARTGHGYSRAQRAALRREYIERLSEWITQE
jgi:hypothetical protein